MLDIRTLLIGLALLWVVRAAALVLAYRLQKHYAPIRYWAIGSSLVAIGFLVVALRGPIPLAVSVLLGHGLVLCGWASIDLGLVRAAGWRPPQQAFAWLVVLTSLGLAWFVLGVDDYQTRTVLITVTPGIMDVYAAYCCLRPRQASAARHAVLRWIGWMQVGITLANGIKLWFVLQHSGPVLFAADWRNALFYLYVIAYAALQTALLILLAAQRIEDRLGVSIRAQARAQETVRRLAYFDPLTQLPNRRLLDDRLQQALSLARRNRQCGAVLMLDLDNFKPLNDSQGHAVGDLLLQEVAHRLTACLRAADTASRVGGDEFVVVLSGLSATIPESESQALAVAEKIRLALGATYTLSIGTQVEPIEHRCTASIGVALFCTGSAGDALKQADQAMYQAKAAGRNRVELFRSAAPQAA
ncbi:GGDEF domain-containing protein [Curvibacter sp. APW13]|uniref:GGDEF domain-containing protein n=1 Tax=Curvibacter sp. APW13 TaxID=3077236 RepID=UPI0028DD856C|nr:GGDEF domain-containing protein [Curvibacter sp. APW13]MDT8989629.1 GGDEF domain-containing protein [Curvibacter sp. APW13]